MRRSWDRCDYSRYPSLTPRAHRLSRRASLNITALHRASSLRCPREANAAIPIATTITTHEHSGTTRNMNAGCARGLTATSAYSATDATGITSMTMESVVLVIGDQRLDIQSATWR